MGYQCKEIACRARFIFLHFFEKVKTTNRKKNGMEIIKRGAKELRDAIEKARAVK